MKTTLLFLLSIFILGCAGSPMRLGMMSQKELESASLADLCNTYHFNKDKSVKSELIRRNLFSEDEWDTINQKKIAIGSSQENVLCAWGRPTKVNSTIRSTGKTEQWVYRSSGYSRKANYVYMKNGRVTAIQN